jgi:hypothetical protein
MTLELNDHGQIKKLVLPKGWSETNLERKNGHAFSLREFSPQTDTEVRLCLYYRGAPFQDQTGTSFKSILKEPAHSLSAKEVRNLADILEDVCDPGSFKPLAIHTQELNGKPVLLVEGRWLKQEWDTYSLYVSADDTGCVVQQIYLLAPTSSFPKYINEIKERLRRIEWNQV